MITKKLNSFLIYFSFSVLIIISNNLKSNFRTMNKKTLVTIAVLVAITSFITYTFIIVLKKEPVVLQGEVEAKQFKIASKIPGRIQEVAVKKGQKVKKGDFIFAIDSPEIDAKLAEATGATGATNYI